MNKEMIENQVKSIMDRGVQRYSPKDEAFYICRDNLWHIMDNRDVYKYIQDLNGVKFTKAMLGEIVFQLTLVDELVINNNWHITAPTFANGIQINGVIVPYEASQFIKYDNVLPYNFDTSIAFPTIREYMDRIGNGNQEIVKFIENIQYQLIFMSDNPYALIVNVCGKGSSGKSVQINLISYQVGMCNIASGDGSNMSSRFYSAILENKRLQVQNDIVPILNDRICGQLKNVSGDDLILAEVKYKSPKTIASKAIVMITSNIPVSFKDQSSGISRRLVYLPMDSVYSGSPVTQISCSGNTWHGKFINEVPGFIAYLYNILTPADVINNLNSIPSAFPMLYGASIDLINQNNPLLIWMNTRLNAKEESQLQFKVQYYDYQDYCKDNGFKATLSIMSFSNLFFQNIPHSNLKNASINRVRSRSGLKIIGLSQG